LKSSGGIHTTMSPTVTKPAGVTRLKSLLPEVWDLMRPRRGILAIGFVLMVVNRVSGLVLPASTKYLVDDVVGKKQIHLLVPLILVVLGATVVQGITSYSLTQVLSVAAQKLIAELRRKVQAHIGRLPVTYFDSNKSGTLVSRIMSDVEGIRNLIGTGLVEFAGGILTAAISFIILMTISPRMTGMALVLVLSFSFFLQKALSKIRPIFKERGKITADVTGRLTEFLGGIRGEGIPRRGARRECVRGRCSTVAGQRPEEPGFHLADDAFGNAAARDCQLTRNVLGGAADSGGDSDARRFF